MGDYIDKLWKIGNTDVGGLTKRVWCTYQGLHREINWAVVKERASFVVAMTLLTTWTGSFVLAIAGSISLIFGPDRETWHITLVCFLVFSCLIKLSDLDDLYVEEPESEKDQKMRREFNNIFSIATMILAFFVGIACLSMLWTVSQAAAVSAS